MNESTAFEVIPVHPNTIRHALGAGPLRVRLALYLATTQGAEGARFLAPRGLEVDDLLRRLAIDGEAVEEALCQALGQHLASRQGESGPADDWSRAVAAQLHGLEDLAARAKAYAVAAAVEQASLCAIDVTDEAELIEVVAEPAPVEPVEGQADALREEVARLRGELAALEERSCWDAVTGLGNARYFERRLTEELSRARRRPGLGLSLLAVRVCNLEPVVAAEGPAAGDELVRRVSAFLVGNLREYDVCCRTAPDLFLVLLPQTDEQNGKLVRARLLWQIASQELGQQQVYLAIGAAGFPEDGAGGEALMARALAEIGAGPAVEQGPIPAAPQAVRVWFPGLAQPVRAKAVVTGQSVRLRTELAFLQLNETVDLSLDGGGEVQTGVVRGVAVAASDRSPVPWLHVEVALP